MSKALYADSKDHHDSRPCDDASLIFPSVNIGMITETHAGFWVASYLKQTQALNVNNACRYMLVRTMRRSIIGHASCMLSPMSGHVLLFYAKSRFSGILLYS